MSRTFSQIYIQVVFAVQGRQNLIQKSWKDELHKYISGIITEKNQKSIIVNGMPDHIHAFIGLKPSMAILLMTKNSLIVNFHGKKVMVHFLIIILKFPMFMITY